MLRCPPQVLDALNSKYHLTTQAFFTTLACVVGSLQVVLVSLWIVHTRRQAALDAALDKQEEEEEARGMKDVLTEGPHHGPSHHDITELRTADSRLRLLGDAGTGQAPALEDHAQPVWSLLRDPSYMSAKSYITSASNNTSRSARRSHVLSRAVSRATITCVEEVLALPPEDREALAWEQSHSSLPLSLGPHDPLSRSFTQALGSGINSSYGALDSGGGAVHHKLAQTLLEEGEATRLLTPSGDVSLATAMEDERRLTELPFLQQVATKEWGFLIVIAMITIYRTQWYVTGTQPYLESIGEWNPSRT